jgi:hypothetical protein
MNVVLMSGSKGRTVIVRLTDSNSSAGAAAADGLDGYFHYRAVQA